MSGPAIRAGTGRAEHCEENSLHRQPGSCQGGPNPMSDTTHDRLLDRVPEYDEPNTSATGTI